MQHETHIENFVMKWDDVDPNQHVRHTVFLDYAAHVRLSYLNQKGFDANYFKKHFLGPILFKEQIEFFKEAFMMEEVSISLIIGDVSETGHKWEMLHEVKRGEDLLAKVQVWGAWLDLKTRRVAPPPEDLQKALLALK